MAGDIYNSAAYYFIAFYFIYYVYTMNIPIMLKRLPEGFSGKKDELGGEYAGIKEGHNDWKV
jgi:hypothetical protein